MNTVKLFSIALITLGFSAQAQDIESAKKAIDAEQFEKAKNILKATIKAKPDNGKASFLLGNVYLKQAYADSAKAAYQKGLTAKEFANFNYIGLGQIDLNNGNASAAQFNFDQATKSIKKKDIEELIYIGKALTSSEKPDFKKALVSLNKAKLINPNDASLQLALGDAFYGDKNQNEAFSAYRNAFDTDNSMLKAKMQLGVLLKGANAYPAAKKAFDDVIALNANYGPVYRELAETYKFWADSDKTKYAEYTQKAIGFYEKYMTLTDYSLASRMRHADFLVITKDYKALEKEAEEMKKLDKVNPRILRYLGFAAYENGNYPAALKALTDFTANPTSKLIGRDFLYLGLAKIRKAIPETVTAENKTGIDNATFDNAILDLAKAVQMDKPMANELNDFGKPYFDKKLYKQAAAIYEVATSNPNSQNYLYDNFYLGYAIYFDNANKATGEKVDEVALKKADKAFENVTLASATTQDAYIYRARVNSLLEGNQLAQDQMAKSYEDYVRVVTAKGDAEISKASSKTKFVEAYQNLAIYNSKLDKVKAKDFVTKALAIEPTNADLLNLQKAIK